MPDLAIVPKRLKTKVIAAEVPTQASLMTLLVAVVTVSALYLAREVLIPITLAILLSFVLAPLVARLRRLGLWRVPSVFLAVFLALSVIVLLGGVIGTQLASLGSRAPIYATTVQQKLGSVQQYATTQLSSLIGRFGHPIEAPKPPQASPAPDAGAVKPMLVEVRQPEATPLELLERVLAPVLGPLGSLGIMLVVAVFILMQIEDLRDRMIRLFGSGDLHRTTAAMDDAAERLSNYFLAQLALNAGFGVVVTLMLLAIGIPSPALFGIIAALFRFVPYIGAVGAALLPILLAAAVDPGWTLVIVTAAGFMLVEALTGQVIEPLVYGHSTGLSPVSVVVAAIFWTWLWGPVGLILSMPLTLCLVVLGRHVEHLEFIDVLLGDQPALTPAEGFYQRMLAGDADEALDQAETLLRDRPLSAYYDEVALSGLQMASNDSVRGVLTAEQFANIQDAIAAVVLDLADHADAGPKAPTAEGAHPGTVLCVAARGPLDESACSMLAQILAKRGLHARIVSRDAVSRANIDLLDLSDIAVVCVSHLEAVGSLSGLRYLMRRLRQRAPGVPVVVGFWQANLVGADRDRLKLAVGADHYTTSLSEAVEECVARATTAPQAAEPIRV